MGWQSSTVIITTIENTTVVAIPTAMYVFVVLIDIATSGGDWGEVSEWRSECGGDAVVGNRVPSYPGGALCVRKDMGFIVTLLHSV